MSIGEGSRGSAWPTLKRRYTSLPTTCPEDALERLEGRVTPRVLREVSAGSIPLEARPFFSGPRSYHGAPAPHCDIVRVHAKVGFVVTEASPNERAAFYCAGAPGKKEGFNAWPKERSGGSTRRRATVSSVPMTGGGRSSCSAPRWPSVTANPSGKAPR